MEIQLTKYKKWYYRLVGANQQTLLTSETYYSKWNAKRAAKKVAQLNKLPYREVM